MKAQRGVQMWWQSVLTSALDGDGSSAIGHSRFKPGKETRCPSCRRPGGHQGRYGRLRKASPYLDLIPGQSRPYQVPLPNKLSRPAHSHNACYMSCCFTNHFTFILPCRPRSSKCSLPVGFLTKTQCALLFSSMPTRPKPVVLLGFIVRPIN